MIAPEPNQSAEADHRSRPQRVWKITEVADAIRTLARALICTLATALALLGSTHVMAEGEVSEKMISRDGVWTLKDLGYSDTEAQIVSGVDEPFTSFEYQLPEDARQGPDTWYLLYLHARVILRESGPRGPVHLVGSTNKAAAAQISLRPTLSKDVIWSTTDLTSGGRFQTIAGLTAEIRFVNYLQISGVRHGENILDFKIDKIPSSADVESVIIFDDTAIIRTATPPPKMILQLIPPDSDIAAGDYFTVYARVKNEGWPIKDVEIALENPGSSLTLMSHDRIQLRSFRGQIDVPFMFRADHVGVDAMEVRAGGNTGGLRSAALSVRIAEVRPSPLLNEAARFITAGVLIASGLGATAWGLRGVRNMRLQTPIKPVPLK